MLSLPVSNLVHRVGYPSVYSSIIHLGRDFSDPLRFSFSPISLFDTGVQGAWYDPTDLTTLYQDAAGTTPVTAMEQPVGMILDKSKGLVLGSELVTNGDFATDTGWTKGTGWSISGGRASIDGSNAGSSLLQLNSGVAVTAGKTYKVTFQYSSTSGRLRFNPVAGNATALMASGTSGVFTGYIVATADTSCVIQAPDANTVAWVDNISVRELPGNHAFNPSGNSANFPVLSARYNLLVGTETLATQSVTTSATTQKLTFTGTGSITLSGTATGTYSAGTYSVTTTAGTLTLTVSGTVTKADLRAANDALNQPTYQRVNTASDYDTVGFKPYLKFNGINQSLQTNSIDFSYSDKMFVSAGVRKLSDALAGNIAEIGTTTFSTDGSFGLRAPAIAAANYGFLTRGTAYTEAVSTAVYPSPITSVISGVSSISTPNAALRVNGSQVAQSTATQGTGTYGNYPLYIGARNNISLFFNGRLYGLVVAGKSATPGEISRTESYLNQRTGAY